MLQGGDDVNVRVWLVACVLGLAGAAHAASASPPTSARPRVLVLDPASVVLDAPTRETLGTLVLHEVALDKRFDVVSMADVRHLADLEGEKQAAGCSENSCLTELAGALGARYVVFGAVGPLGRQFLLNLNVFDAASATAVGRVQLRYSAVEELPDMIVAPVHELMSAVASAAQKVARETPIGGATPAASTPVTTSNPRGVPVLPWALLGSGVLVGGAGIVLDQVMPTSNNARVDAFDWLYAGAMATGAGLTVAGVWLLIVGGGDA